MLGMLSDLLSRQDPKAKHSLLTRILVCAIILVATGILYALYGVFASVAVYLVGVELMGMPLRWAFIPLLFAVLMGLWKGAAGIRDYLANYGHGSA